jgi:4-aminobutyrate aminotransferase / (S)-3-amino-2-methylpropionate transaminase / 5-aminovalerate transaminase
MGSIKINTPIPGPNGQAILERRKNALAAGLAKATDVVVASAKGAVITDVDGNQLLDFAGGIGMINVGHAPRKIVNAVKKQLDDYIHTCNIVTTIEPYVQLAELLNEVVPGDFPKKTILANAGGEAVENAVNVARYATGRSGILVFEGAYHGRTLLTMSMTSKYNLFKKGYSGFASDIYRIAVPDMYRTPAGMKAADYEKYYLDRLDHAMVSQVDPSALAAIVIEPVQGEGGFQPMPKPFLQKLRDICDKHGIVLIFDEIQCGMGRTGKLFASEHYGIVPDMTITAKSLGAGMPISAVVGRADLMDKPHLGAVGGTYGGSPVACVAAIEAVKMLTSEEFQKHAERMGEVLRKRLDNWKKKYKIVGDVRGIGAMRLVEFVKDRDTKEPDADKTLAIIRESVANGVILIRAGLFSNCIRFLPPLSMTTSQLNEGLDVLQAAIAKHNA